MLAHVNGREEKELEIVPLNVIIICALKLMCRYTPIRGEKGGGNFLGPSTKGGPLRPVIIMFKLNISNR